MRTARLVCHVLWLGRSPVADQIIEIETEPPSAALADPFAPKFGGMRVDPVARDAEPLGDSGGIDELDRLLLR